MARGLMQEPVFAATLHDCDRILSELGYPQPLSSVLEGPQVTDVALGQPALCAFQLALVDLFGSWGIKPAAVIGHSVGEAAAAVTSGALTRRDGLRLVLERSRLQASVAGQGGMALVSAAADAVSRHLPTGVTIAGENGPRATLIAGGKAAVTAACARARQSRHRQPADRCAGRLSQRADGSAAATARGPPARSRAVADAHTDGVDRHRRRDRRTVARCFLLGPKPARAGALPAGHRDPGCRGLPHLHRTGTASPARAADAADGDGRHGHRAAPPRCRDARRSAVRSGTVEASIRNRGHAAPARAVGALGIARSTRWPAAGPNACRQLGPNSAAPRWSAASVSPIASPCGALTARPPDAAC